MLNQPDEAEIPFLYRDEDLCVIDKPAGMFIHPHRADPDAPDCIAYLKKRLDRFIHTIHRIDRPTSGAALFAFHHDAASDLSRQFREGLIEKRYIALVRGHLREAVVIDLPIPRDKKGERVHAVSRATPIARATYDAPVSRYSQGWFTLVEVELKTGRYHQIRRHLRSIGHPVIGDTTHGDIAQNEFFRSTVGEARLFLRSYALGFILPESDKPVLVESGLPDWWIRSLAVLGFKSDEIDSYSSETKKSV